MKSFYVVVRNTIGVWGSNLVCFVKGEESSITSVDVVNALRLAEAKVSEDLSYAAELVDEMDVEDMLLSEAAKMLGASWHYAIADSFDYTIDCY